MNKRFAKFLSYFIISQKSRKIFRQEIENNSFNGRIYFSQYGEDIIMSVILQYIFSQDYNNIKYLDIGSNDPKLNNNTYFFYKNKGKGICIEPNPYYAKQYRKIRPSDTFINAGIKFSKNIDSATYYDFGILANGLNTFSEERKNEVIKTYPLEKVHTLPLVDINEQFEKLNGVDIVSIDVEGLELEILKTIDFDNPKYRPKIFCIEANKKEIECGAETELIKYLKERDYILVADNFINLIFADVKQSTLLKLYNKMFYI